MIVFVCVLRGDLVEEVEDYGSFGYGKVARKSVSVDCVYRLECVGKKKDKYNQVE